MLFIDYTNCVPLDGVKISGGAEYARRMIALLDKNNILMTVLVPSVYKDVIDEDAAMFQLNNVRVETIEKITKYAFPKNEFNTLFIPLMATHRISDIEKIKGNNPNLHVYVTIHGTRLVDLKPDALDSYYLGSNQSMYMIKQRIKYFATKKMYAGIFCKYMPLFDGVFTVSNDSMQKIQSICKPCKLLLFYCGSLNSDFDHLKSVSYDKDDYFLFVSGGRPEKNLLRTLIAFQKFRSSTNGKMRLIATGLSEEIQKRLKLCPELDFDSIRDYVELLPYVSSNELKRLYANCKCMLYPSKSEGFGLPLIDACYNNIPCITSSITATPEVLGSAAIYVNPYSVESIAEGMNRFENTDYKIMVDSVVNAQLRAKYSIEAADKDFVAFFKDILTQK